MHGKTYVLKPGTIRQRIYTYTIQYLVSEIMSSVPYQEEQTRKPRSYDHMIAEFAKQKENFKVDQPIDQMIASFIMELNQNPNIVTLYSCEGHEPDDESNNQPYLFFNVNTEGSVKLWNFVIPEMLIEASAINLFIHIEVYTDVTGTNGIVFRGYYPLEVWAKAKHAFWHIVSKHMLKHF